ncbi:MAG: aminotransferase class IV [Bacteroidales bacterium]
MNFIESIRVKDGRLCNLEAHVRRSSDALMHHFGISGELPFCELYNSACVGTEEDCKGLYKLRVVYGREVVSVSLAPYKEPVSLSLKIVECNHIDYSFKYEDRTVFADLLKYKGDCDDILIVKDGLVTDTSYGNIVYELDGELFTPASPLLKGTRREYMLQEGLLKERNLQIGELHRSSAFYMINAMLNMLPVTLLR